jgi:hypothetical protein
MPDRASGVNDTAFIVHAVSMTPHALKKIRISSRIRIFIRKGFTGSPLIRGPDEKKTEGRKSRDTVPLSGVVSGTRM